MFAELQECDKPSGGPAFIIKANRASLMSCLLLNLTQDLCDCFGFCHNSHGVQSYKLQLLGVGANADIRRETAEE